MIRNAVDHGIEDSVQERLDAGKPEKGRVFLRAFHRGGSIFIEIEDDGRGLQREAILAKARERGLIDADDVLSDREIWNLIFVPGFSTARTVTDVSGRGVGMDVVKRNIHMLRGQIELQSEPGKGTLVSIRLPLTLAIIDGMVVRVAEERYIVPTQSIVMAIRVKDHHLSTVTGRGEMVDLHGALIPLFRLHRLLSVEDVVENASAVAVVVEADNKRVALLADELLGQQQTVIKSLGEGLRGLTGFAGGAIMADGNVGLILDVAGVVRLAEGSGSGRPASLALSGADAAAEVQS
jgi:two-component system chemotaxis sensor kinase CheA